MLKLLSMEGGVASYCLILPFTVLSIAHLKQELEELARIELFLTLEVRVFQCQRLFETIRVHDRPKVIASPYLLNQFTQSVDKLHATRMKATFCRFFHFFGLASLRRDTGIR